MMDSSDDDTIEPGDDEPSSQNLPFLGVCGLLPITCLGCHEGCSQKNAAQAWENMEDVGEDID